MDNVYRAESWQQLQELLFEDTWDRELSRYRSNYVYRGLSDVQYKLDASFTRVCNGHLQLEGHLLRNFEKYSANEYSRRSNMWKLVALAQHHGLPTRLLDWTYSPYIALHFATANLEEYDKDGVVWCVNFVKAHELLPKKLKDELVKEGAQSFTTEILHEGIKDYDEMKALADNKDYVVFFEPPSIDNRIVNQYALFSVLSDPSISLDDWLDQHGRVYRKIIIPKELKWEIRDKLDQSNITERVLFPGLDGICKWLTRQYTTK